MVILDGEVFPLGQVVPVDLNRWCQSFGCLFFRYVPIVRLLQLKKRFYLCFL